MPATVLRLCLVVPYRRVSLMAPRKLAVGSNEGIAK